MGKYFGTDGIRGIAGRELTPEFALRAGRAVGSVLRATYRGAKLPYFGQVDDQLPHPCVLLGRDTRMSSPMLADAVRSGLLSAGVSVADLGIVPTPLVGLMANRFNALGGVMITASHNPVDHNGIKVFRSDGLKIGGRTVAAMKRGLTRAAALLRGAAARRWALTSGRCIGATWSGSTGWTGRARGLRWIWRTAPPAPPRWRCSGASAMTRCRSATSPTARG